MKLVENLVVFGRILRASGFPVDAGRLADLAGALAHVDVAVRDDVYCACRALLVQRHEHLAIFESAFAAFWRVHHAGQNNIAAHDARSPASRTEVIQIEDAAAGDSPDQPSGDSVPEERVKVWSDAAALGRKDFAALTAEELAQARRALSDLVWQPGVRRTRRWVRGRGARVDLRRAIADSLRSGGDIVRLPRRKRRERPRPLVLLCDISGSMERYTRMLLHFAHAVTQRHHRVETFLFSTSLTRVTRQLRAAGPDHALVAVSQSVSGWSGGTRTGAALKEFHQRWSRRVLNRGPVALLISDGWDRGDPKELGQQVARLQRSCHRLIWLNPLIGTTDYAPLTRGLQAALPFVDDFLPVRTLNNLAQLAIHLNRLA
jgi:uncharacterized protein with von Willebrand factor type A (vWA) domain